jgi:FkbM family methyltransferase
MIGSFFNLISDDKSQWFNIGLNHSQGKFPLYVTRYQTNTSLYKPNLNFINTLCYGESDFKIDQVVEIECDTLDNVLLKNSIKIDYIKLDTQGSELDILKGGASAIDKNIFAIELEVEFNEFYKNQPVFADVDIYLRRKKYILMDIGNMLHVKGKNTVGIGGQTSFLISGDALYFKTIDETIKMIQDQDQGLGKFYSVISICLVYGYTDYALELCYKIKNDDSLNIIDLEGLIKDITQINHIS